MKQEQRTIYTIVKNGTAYRFTDIVNHGTHYSAKQILDNDKSAFLMTIYNRNSEDRPDLGKCYLEGDYVINGTAKGKV
jgi:hypothetical protein